MQWFQNYDPLGNAVLSTLMAALPIVVLLGSIALFQIRIHFSALIGLAVALGIAVFVYGMPVRVAGATTIFGAAYGLFPIGWIILNLIFLYQLTVNKGLFTVLRSSLATLAPDPRIQVILIAFSLGSFFEGAAGFGTPVAVTAAILMQLGFKPLAASGLSLIANTAPVAYGALGTPIIALSGVTGLDLKDLSAMVGRQLPFFSIIVPFWVVWAFAGFRGMMGVWPAALVAGVAFAIPQFLVSNFHGPWLVDIIASIASMAALAVLLRFWRPQEIWQNDREAAPEPNHSPARHSFGEVAQAWTPWLLLSMVVFIWGLPVVKAFLNGISVLSFPVANLDQVVFRVPPVAPEKKAEAAVFVLNWLSATGTGILVAGIVSGLIMRFSLKEMARIYGETLIKVRFSLITIAAMLALGYVTKYSGTDATLGLALAKTGVLYPFFGTLLGWLGVALTGSDTASNVLFGSLQKITAEQTGLSPTLMAAANSTGGVMGKMVDAQSIVVASTATNWYGHEGAILRYVFFHSVALAVLVGILVFLQAYVFPFTSMVVR
ncbi:MAG: L-lactate permease [Verrucomicrobiota bacterium]